MYGPLGEALRRAHDTRRTDGLVGRDQNEMGDAKLSRHLSHISCPLNVVQDRLGNVLLHEGYVLVRGCVEYRIRAVPSHDHRHALTVTNIGNHRSYYQPGERSPKLVHQFEDRVLSPTERHDARRSEL